jgi:hypothetical protein
MQIDELRCTTYHSANPVPVPQAVHQYFNGPQWTSMDLNHFEALVAS